MLFLIADPIARFLGIPEVVWAYQLLALVPVIKAFEHFDIHRVNRQMRFWPMIITGGVPAFLSLLMVWPLIIWLGDWRVMLYAILMQIGLTVMASHLIAERRYRLVLDSAIMGRSLRFGWPILVNSVLLFFVFQGDKLIVARALGMKEMAIFAMGMTLTLTPTIVIAKSAQNFFLPQLSAVVETSCFSEISDRTLQIVTGAALIFLLIIFLFGGPFLHTILGEKYLPLIPLLIWFGIGQAVRLIKVGPAIVAMSIGHTSNAMKANIPRVLILPLIWIIAEYTGSLLHILWIVILGEVLGAILALLLLVRRSRLTAVSVFVPQLPVVCAMTMLMLWTSIHPPTTTLPNFEVGLSLALVMGGLIVMMPAIRRLLWQAKQI